MKPFRMSLFLSSYLLLFSYTVCTLLAYLNYRLDFSPLNNWLSDLGNKVLDPAGAIFYNAGIFISAFWLLTFFLGFSTVKGGENKLQGLMVLLAQLFGIAGCAAMALSAFFTIDDPGPHSFLSAVLDISRGTAFAFSVAALRYNPKWPRGLLLLGLLATSFDLLASVFFNNLPVFEWITVTLFLAYVVSIGVWMKCRQSNSAIFGSNDL